VLKIDKIDAKIVYSYDVTKNGSSDPSDGGRKGTLQVKPDNKTRYITIVTSERTALKEGEVEIPLEG
jgi:hypothetical protein